MNDSELRHVAYEWANFHGTQGEGGFIRLELLYRSHDFYPVAALFTAPHGIDRITETEGFDSSGSPNIKREKVSFAEGMTGEIHFSSVEGELPEKWFVSVIKLIDDHMLAMIVKPSNFPVCPSRKSIALDPQLRKNAPGIDHLGAPWAEMATVAGLIVPVDIEVDDTTSIISLTTPDIIEMQEWLRAHYGLAFMMYRPPTHAVCRRHDDPSKSSPLGRLIDAISLFKMGHLETEYGFRFSTNIQREQSDEPSEDTPRLVYTQLSISYSPDRSYSWDAPKLMIGEEDVNDLESWLQRFMSITIAQNSLMFRALQRYRRTFHTEDIVERITDTVIGLETVTAPAIQTEINYRVAQRASFLVSTEPREDCATPFL